VEGLSQVQRQKSRPREEHRDTDSAQDAGATEEKSAPWVKWHRHSCLCAFAEAGNHRLAYPVASLTRDFSSRFLHVRRRRNLTRRSSVVETILDPVPLVKRTGRSACATGSPSKPRFLIYGGAIKTPRN